RRALGAQCGQVVGLVRQDLVRQVAGFIAVGDLGVEIEQAVAGLIVVGIDRQQRGQDGDAFEQVFSVGLFQAGAGDAVGVQGLRIGLVVADVVFERVHGGPVVVGLERLQA